MGCHCLLQLNIYIFQYKIKIVTITLFLCLKFVKGVYVKCSHHVHRKNSKKWELYEVIDVLTTLTMVIISKYIGLSNHCIVYLKSMQFLFVNYTLIRMGKINGYLFYLYSYFFQSKLSSLNKINFHF